MDINWDYYTVCVSCIDSEDSTRGEFSSSSPQPLNCLKDHVNFSVTIQNLSFSVTMKEVTMKRK